MKKIAVVIAFLYISLHLSNMFAINIQKSISGIPTNESVDKNGQQVEDTLAWFINQSLFLIYADELSSSDAKYRLMPFNLPKNFKLSKELEDRYGLIVYENPYRNLKMHKYNFALYLMRTEADNENFSLVFACVSLRKKINFLPPWKRTVLSSWGDYHVINFKKENGIWRFVSKERHGI